MARAQATPPPGGGEGRHEPVAKRLDGATTMRPHLLTRQLVARGQDRLRLDITAGRMKGGGALDVCEEDGDGSLGQPLAHLQSRSVVPLAQSPVGENAIAGAPTGRETATRPPWLSGTNASALGSFGSARDRPVP
jgi:hypothetical protein